MEFGLLGVFGEGDFIFVIMFLENDLLFYVVDDIDYREMNIYIGIEDILDYYLKV